jgi:hypothetical protein
MYSELLRYLVVFYSFYKAKAMYGVLTLRYANRVLALRYAAYRRVNEKILLTTTPRYETLCEIQFKIPF